ncbi:oligosaccharide flippase family protein [Bacillus sp. D-CC]
MKKVFSNFIYQAIFQVMKIIIPIITIPIISRALGPEGVGIYNYTYSITSYFILFAGLGITLYGSREIALVQQDREKLSETFWEIFKLKAILSLVNLFAFIILSSQLDYSLYLEIQV